jgi:hypothetical protein
MNLRILFLSLAILASASTNGQEPYKTRSYEWNAEKERAWDILRTEFPEYTSTDWALKATYAWIRQWDAWAKVNDPELYDNPMKPLIYARRQKTAEISSAAKNEQQSAAEEERRKALTESIATTQQTKLAQQVVANGTSSGDTERSGLTGSAVGAIWLGSAIIFIITIGVAWGLHRIIRPRHGVISAAALGRKWAAWVVAILTITSLPSFFHRLNVDSFTLWAFGVVALGTLAFSFGWIIGLFKFRKKNGQESSPAISPPPFTDALTANPAKDSLEKTPDA